MSTKATTATATYTILGTTDHITTCDHCGRTELKGTVALTRDDSTDVIYMGSTCAARAITKSGRKTSAANVRDEAAAMRRYMLEDAAAARELLAHYGIDADTDSPVIGSQLDAATVLYRAAHRDAVWAAAKSETQWRESVMGMVVRRRAQVAAARVLR